MDTDPLDFLLSGPVEPAQRKTAAELLEEDRLAKIKYFVDLAWSTSRANEARWSASATAASAPAAPARSAAAQARLAQHIEADRLFRLERSK